MSENTILIGAESVKSAGYTMLDAAERMNCAANQIHESFSRHERFIDDWLAKFEKILSQRMPGDAA